MSDIVGKKFIISTKCPRSEQYTIRTIHITGEFTKEGKRMYKVKERGRDPFEACADIYDQYFLIVKGKVRPKGYKGHVSNGPALKVNQF